MVHFLGALQLQKPFEYQYIQSLCCSILLHEFYLRTSWSFEEILHSKPVVVISDPKGVGKSSSLIGIMAQFSVTSKPAILLTQHSLKYKNATLQYLDKFEERFKIGEDRGMNI